jgi:hypothetical protein
MAVNLSPYGGVGAQFLDNSGNVLTGGKIETYAAGTTTPQATYTTSAGNIPHSNPIILDASGRVPSGGEIWLTDGLVYKFILRNANDVLIATYDGITGINSNFVAFTNQQEIQTATAGQTVFNLTTTTYQPGTNSLSVFVDGVNQYGPGAQYAYLETDSDTVTFVTGLHVGAEVKFTTSQLNTSGSTNTAGQISFTGFKGQAGTVQDLADDDGSDWIGFEPAGANAVARSAQDKMRETVSVYDFGAVGDGVADDTVAIQNFFDYAQANQCFAVMEGVFKVSSAITSTGGAGSTFYFNATLNASVAMNWVIKFVSHSAIYFAGYLQVFGAGASNNYADRLCLDGVVLEGCRGSRFEKLLIERFLRHGVLVSATGNNTLLNLGDVRVHFCGSCASPNFIVDVPYTARSDTGSAGSQAQRTVLTLTTPTNVEVFSIVSIDDEPYLITAFNASSITVFPWTRTTASTGTVQFYIGSGVTVAGDDAANVNFDSIDATYSSSALNSASLYGAYAQRVVTQFCGVGVKIGNNSSSNYFGTKLDNYYTEGNKYNLVQSTYNAVNSIVDNYFEMDFSKIFKLVTRDATREYVGSSSVMTSVQIFGKGQSIESTEDQFGLGYYTTSYAVEARNETTYIKGGNTIEIDIFHDLAKERLFGYNSQTFVVFGRRTGNRVDSVTFTTSDSGATIMGGASYVISPVTTVLMITAWYDYENTNWVISKFVPV